MTRPAPDHQALLAALAAKGVAAIHCPAFELESAPEQSLAQQLSRIGEVDLTIVTSPVAARLLARHLDTDQPGVSEVQFVVPGRGTASALEAVGIAARFPVSGGTSEHILAMPEFDDVSHKRIAVVGAPGGRGLLASELSARGADVENMHVYHRRALAPSAALVDALHHSEDLVIFISSLQAFSIILESLPEALRPVWLNSRFVVSSARIQRACRDAGVRRIRCAAGASDEEMLAAVDEDWLHGHDH